MTAADVIQPSASIASPGLGIRYIGQHAYAYSSAAALTAAAGEVTRLSFTTGSGYIVGKLNGLNGDTSGDTWFISVFMNGTLMMSDKTNNASAGHADNFNILPILIPPFTFVEVKLQVGADSDSVSAQLVGRVYGAD